MAQPRNPHERPPDELRAAYKAFQRMSPAMRQRDDRILDFGRGLTGSQSQQVRVIDHLDPDHLANVFAAFEGSGDGSGFRSNGHASPTPVYEHADVPGLHIIPNLLPASTQVCLLDKILHRDLAHPVHRTNLHAHHALTYPPLSSSFFSLPNTHPSFQPHDPAHKTVPLDRFLRKSLRWVTLGGQYDWTAKVYPASLPAVTSDDINPARPPFPADIAGLLRGIFSDTEPHAAIANVYSPGDVLSPHRDVSETVGNGLVSCSVGCSGLFLISGREDDASDPNEHGAKRLKYLHIRLRSGDVVYMSGPSRWAWHGVSAVEAGSCPEFLQSWPAPPETNESGDPGPYERWRGWMAGKRVNLNVRQMD